MHLSICMATKDKAEYLDRTLETIRAQKVPFDYEIVIADDGSTDNTKQVCEKWGVEKYTRLINSEYRNPAAARNVSYKKAEGKIIICQSDDVLHSSEDVIATLSGQLRQKEFIIATVYNWDNKAQRRLMLYTGAEWKRNLFFLGSLWRDDLYAVGGNDEDFVAPGYDDNWFGDCLTKGLKLKARFRSDVIGYHQDHPRSANLKALMKPSKVLYARKTLLARQGKIPWQASGGPWAREML